MKFYSSEINSIISFFETRITGLTSEEARKKLEDFGRNELPEKSPDSIFRIFLRQFQSPLIYILLGACLIVFILGEVVDAAVILVVLSFNAVVGSFQEGKAQNTLSALKKFVKTNATVLRDDNEIVINDSEVVPGDIIILEEGQKIPTDSRIFISNNLKVDEAALTGESTPADKMAEFLKGENLPTAGQKNMVFKGTYVVSGNGRAIAVATGRETIIGKIASEITGIETEIPLKTNIRHLSQLIIWITLGISTVLFVGGIIIGQPIKQMFISVVALSVSIIPEGLPIAITLVLATGVWRMSKRNALVKRLQAVEALGQARIIAVDKTGTITKNELMVEEVYSGGYVFRVQGVGYDPGGEIWVEGGAVNVDESQELSFAAKVAAYCTNGRTFFNKETGAWGIVGEPTEAALAVFSEKAGIKKEVIEAVNPLIEEVPFNHKTKHHLVLHREEGGKFMSAVGAPEVILAMSSKVYKNGEIKNLTEGEKENIEKRFSEMSERGMRVLAFATKSSKTVSIKDTSRMVFGGLFGMRDVIRPEALGAMKKSMRAGMRVVMITGDHKLTAVAIAKEIGIWKNGDSVVTGPEIDQMSESEFAKNLSGVSVFARVTPEHKLKIIKAYREKGEIVAMTGDGVNDALSLVAADLGVAMGKIGTEVAKEAADIILLDDDFGNIVSAVEEGRNIYKTVKKVILYLFSTSLGEVLTISAALFMGYPLPILPSQIIWLNFVTDGFLTVALAMEPKEEGLLRGSFERSKKYLVDKLMAQRMFIMAIPMAIGALVIFRNYFDVDMAKALTMSLTVLAVFQWFNAWNCRHEYKSVFRSNPFANRFLVGAIAIVISLQMLAIYNPFFQKVLHTVPLSLSEWFIVIPVAASILVFEELRKWIHNLKSGS